MARVPDGGAEDILASAQAGPKAIRGGLVRVAGYGVGLALALISTPLLIRHLGVEDLGGYVAVLSLVTIVALVSDAGLTVIALREYAVRDEASRRVLLSNIVSLRAAISLAGALVAIGFALVAGYSPALLIGTMLAASGIVLLSIQQTLIVPLSAELRLATATGLDILRQLLTVAAIVLLVFADAGVTAFLAVSIPVGVAVLACTLVATRRRVSPLALRHDEWGYLLRQILPVAAASVLGAFFYRVAIIMMSVISTEQQAGLFAASYRVTEVIVPIPSLLVGVAFPILSRAAVTESDRLRYALQKLFDVGLILGAGTALFLVLGAEPIMAFLGGSELDGAVGVLQIQAPAMLASFLVAVWAGGLYAVNAQRDLVIAGLIGITSVTVLTSILGSSHGARGAAISMTVSEILFAAACGVLLMRKHPQMRVQLTAVPKVALALGAGGALALSGLPPVAAVTLAMLVYFGVVLVTRAIPEEVWQALGRRNRAPA